MNQNSNNSSTSPDTIAAKLRDTAALEKVMRQAVIEVVEKARKLGYLPPSVQEES